MAKWNRGHRNIHPMTNTHVAVNVWVLREDGSPSVQGYVSIAPVADDPESAVASLAECRVVNVPRHIAADVVALWQATANLRSEQDAALSSYADPQYDADCTCLVCAAGGFCRDAARELAHDIACILKMTGELAEPFEQAQQNVARWMAANHITSGDSSLLCDRYMEGMKVAA